MLEKGMSVTAPCQGRFIPQEALDKLLEYKFQVDGGIGEDGKPWFGYKAQLNMCNEENSTLRVDRNRWRRKAEKKGSFSRIAAHFLGGFGSGMATCQAIK